MPSIQSLIHSIRRQTYHLDADVPRLTSPADFVSFVDAVGFSLLFPADDIELPALSLASDALRANLLRWKDALPTEKQLYVGRIFRRRPAFIALSLLPSLYALSATALLNGDRFELFKNRYISPDVNRIAGALAAKGPLTTRELRRTIGFAADEKRGSFRRTLADAETAFIVAQVEAPSGQPATYGWDTFARAWPDVLIHAESLTTEEAGRQIITRYVDTTAAATPESIARLFGLHPPFVEYITTHLIDEGRLGHISDSGQSYLASLALLEALDQ